MRACRLSLSQCFTTTAAPHLYLIRTRKTSLSHYSDSLTGWQASQKQYDDDEDCKLRILCVPKLKLL